MLAYLLFWRRVVTVTLFAVVVTLAAVIALL